MITAAAILIFLAALFFTLYVRVEDIPKPAPVSPVQHLEDRKQAIYDNLRDLQFEYRLGKLSDEDYQRTKHTLQRELAGVLAEMEEMVKRLDLKPVAVPAVPKAVAPPAAVSTVCPHCGAAFPQRLKYCGECGRAIA
ncbi:MAG: hypothetical protein ACRD4O_19300 [Bryobacteraceae bacterium]